jgi:hypothetical protein
MLEVHYPPAKPFIERPKERLGVFLAGTIDVGLSTDWQQIMIDFLRSQFGSQPVDIFNPRRKDWDSTWEQSSSHPMFKRQVEWELTYLEYSDLVLMVFLPGSKSPVSMLELGAMSAKPGLMVFCPEDFYRHGNIDIFCSRRRIPTFNDWDDYLIAVRRKLDGWLIKKQVNV